MHVLFINACVREKSRTLSLCQTFLEQHCKGNHTTVQEISLQDEGLLPLDRQMLDRRNADIEREDFSADCYKYAKDFANADWILIGAPYWDYSFPALLKVYFEHICVNKITFGYTDTGAPLALCAAKRLIYITTAGGYIGTHSSLELYLNELCSMFGIPELRMYKAEGLDIVGNDETAIMNQTMQEFM